MANTGSHPWSSFRRRGVSRALCAAWILWIAAVSGAAGQEDGKPPDAPEPEKAAAAGDKKPPAKSEPEKEKNIDETVKEFQKLTGLFTFYRKKKGTTDTLMMEVPEDRLGQLLMLQVTASTGTGDTPAFIFHGAPLRDLLFQMEKVDDSKILFLQPNIRFRAPRDATARRTRTSPSWALASIRPDTRWTGPTATLTR